MSKKRPTGIHGIVYVQFAVVYEPVAFRNDPDKEGVYLSVGGPLFVGKRARARAEAWLLPVLDEMVAAAGGCTVPQAKPSIIMHQCSRYVSQYWLTPAARVSWNDVNEARSQWQVSDAGSREAAYAALEVRRHLMTVRHGLRDRKGVGSLLWPLEGVGMRVRAKALEALEAAHKAGHMSAHELLEAHEDFTAANAAGGIPSVELDSPRLRSSDGSLAAIAA